MSVDINLEKRTESFFVINRKMFSVDVCGCLWISTNRIEQKHFFYNQKMMSVEVRGCMRMSADMIKNIISPSF